MKQQQHYDPLVSVIIPCYNHGQYLKEAVASVQSQGYPALEVIVVDDGSTDNTAEVAASCKEISYVYQENKGLSAARNTGIHNSNGMFLVFLDADDWLLPDAIRTNVTYLKQNNQLAFVSGGHDKVFVAEGRVQIEATQIDNSHYLHLLQGNYIGMHAAVMYRRQVFNEFQFDASLSRCEDYDLYLRISRKHPVAHHRERIAAYRLHTTNMSGNIPAMLESTLQVLGRQQQQLNSAVEHKAFQHGKWVWKNYYCKELYKQVTKQSKHTPAVAIYTLLQHKPSLLFHLLLSINKTMIKKLLKEKTPTFGRRWLHKMGLHQSFKPPVGRVVLGDFKSLKPFSTMFGYDRGGPIDRYYIELFLAQEAPLITGRVLEIGDNDYTIRFGGKNVSQSDILHVDASNKRATFVGDISNAPQLPDNTFDCIVLTQTLHLIYDFKGALLTCHRVLKPGGTLLLTVPGITPIDHDEWKETWYWSFTDKVMRRLMEETFPDAATAVHSYGNVFAATSFLYGLGLPEVPRAKLDFNDPHFQVIVSVKAVKAAVS